MVTLWDCHPCAPNDYIRLGDAWVSIYRISASSLLMCIHNRKSSQLFFYSNLGMNLVLRVFTGRTRVVVSK